ncbi:helix-turn-helix domain-containing protein, partial [Frankia sp. AgKG'84/4]|uniref:helix-turn-helix domain-containing protein n=1 Tax=Frankia sp. AgKG'84/4 TaxID=573490 RepID=UPI0027E483AA
MSEEIDPATVTTCEEFGRALTAVRVRAGLSVRDVAKAVGIPPSTAGGYFSGAHLPGLKPADLVPGMLRACGVTSPAEVHAWVAAWMRARRHRRTVTKGSAGRPLSGPVGGAAPPVQPNQDSSGTGTDSDGVAAGGAERANLTLRPPVGRLEGLGVIRGRGDLLDRLTTALPAPAGPHQPPGATDTTDTTDTTDHTDAADAADAVGTARVTGDGPTRDTCRVHVLHGLGGVGKSTVALTVAARALDRGVRTWWINAAGPGTVTATMTALAVELGASQHQLAQGSLPDLLWRLLDALDRPWLLVIDNADDPDADLGPPGGGVLDGSGLLRPVSTPCGVVIVTTRDGAAWSSTGSLRPPGWLAPYRL